MELKTPKKKIVLLLACFILATILAYLYLDQGIALDIQQQIPKKIQNLFDLLSYPIEPVLIPMYLLLILKLVESSSKKVQFFINVGAAALVNIVLVTVLKYTLGRPRPHLLFTQNLSGIHLLDFTSGWISMPSGHAAAAGLISGVIWILGKEKMRYLAALPSIMALFRVLCLKHFLSDVLLGYGLGFCLMLLFYQYEKTLFQKLKDRLWKNGKIA